MPLGLAFKGRNGPMVPVAAHLAGIEVGEISDGPPPNVLVCVPPEAQADGPPSADGLCASPRHRIWGSNGHDAWGRRMSERKQLVFRTISERLKKELPAALPRERVPVAVGAGPRRDGEGRRGHALRDGAGRHVLPHRSPDRLVSRRRAGRVGARERHRPATSTPTSRSSSTTRTRPCWPAAPPARPTCACRRTRRSRPLCASSAGCRPSEARLHAGHRLHRRQPQEGGLAEGSRRPAAVALAPEPGVQRDLPGRARGGGRDRRRRDGHRGLASAATSRRSSWTACGRRRGSATPASAPPSLPWPRASPRSRSGPRRRAPWPPRAASSAASPAW